MRRIVQLTAVAVVAAAWIAADVTPCDAIEWGGRRGRRSSYTIDYSAGPWHAGYAHPAWGAPVALVVPPTVRSNTDYRWGVPSSRVSTIDSQFSRDGVPVGVSEAGGFQPRPRWPSDTNQMGVYYIRGPW